MVLEGNVLVPCFVVVDVVSLLPDGVVCGASTTCKAATKLSGLMVENLFKLSPALALVLLWDVVLQPACLEVVGYPKRVAEQ